ncbi:MAG: LysM peptidoglycan-binding domain-containing protein, partial [Polyangiaceae bacterium]
MLGRRLLRLGLPAACLAVLATAVARPASGFPRVVQKGETLARIAERMYGKIEMEQLLVAANGLDGAGAAPVVPGMRLEVPAVSHYRAS